MTAIATESTLELFTLNRQNNVATATAAAPRSPASSVTIPGHKPVAAEHP
jgi:hypothetical protein